MDIESLEKLKSYAEKLPRDTYTYVMPDQLTRLVDLALEAAKHRQRIGVDRGFDAVEALAPKPIPANVTSLRRCSDVSIGGEISAEFLEATKEPK